VPAAPGIGKLIIHSFISAMSNDRLTTYQKTITKEFEFLKETLKIEDAFAKSLDLPAGGGMLTPMCRLYEDDEDLIRQLVEWHRDGTVVLPAHPAESAVEARSWLKDVLGTADRLVFLVLDKHGKRVGHAGFSRCLNSELTMELDDVAADAASGGLLSEALEVLIHWARTTLWPDAVAARASDLNSEALTLLGRLGFGTVQAQAENRLFLQPVAGKAGKTMILTAGPSISAREASYAYKAAKYGWNNQWSHYLKAFESNFAGYIGVKHAMATSSCTGALHIALKALGIGSGDEVIVPDITWVATANAVLYVGATPIFADIDRNTWLLDPASVKAKITPRTKAIIPVHLYGHACDMERLLALAKQHNLYVIEDAAPSIGAEYKGRRTGSFGHFSGFSFQGAKLAVTGEGGMLLTNDESLYKRAYAIWDQGRTPGTFWIETNGLKYKMSNVQAAIGLGQLERNDEMVEAKRRIFRWYEQGLAGVPHVRLNCEPAGTRSIYWMTSILVEESSPLSRDQLAQKLKARNVDTRPVFPAISQYPIWPLKQSPPPVAKFVGDHGMNLPSGVCLRQDEVFYVCEEIKQALTA
jgi:perosamine synthetase